TQEPLGQLELHKARVKVSQVQDRLSVATTLPLEVERFPLSPVGLFGKETVYPQLPLDESIATAVEEVRKLTVKVGDLVRSLDSTLVEDVYLSWPVLARSRPHRLSPPPSGLAASSSPPATSCARTRG